jgi:hypothetical protein
MMNRRQFSVLLLGTAACGVIPVAGAVSSSAEATAVAPIWRAGRVPDGFHLLAGSRPELVKSAIDGVLAVARSEQDLAIYQFEPQPGTDSRRAWLMMLRSDPDIIVIPEFSPERDAEMAAVAALCGHAVLGGMVAHHRLPTMEILKGISASSKTFPRIRDELIDMPWRIDRLKSGTGGVARLESSLDLASLAKNDWVRLGRAA